MLRLAELLSGLSLATDLGLGVPLETSLRTCLVASELARAMELDDAALTTTYYAGLLRHIGCTAFAHEAAELAGDDHDLTRTFEAVDSSRRSAVLGRAIRDLGHGTSPIDRIRAVGRVIGEPSAARRLAIAQCDQAKALASDLGLADVAQTLAQMYERHDGKGFPYRLRGDAIAVPARLVRAAQLIEALYRRSGRDGALAELRRRRGRELAPAVCDVAIKIRDTLWSVLETATAMEWVIEREPGRLIRPPSELVTIARAFAHFADLKSPHRIGHSPAVAALAVAACRHGRWQQSEVPDLEIAALFHDLGTVSVGTQVWERHATLGAVAWEQVRLHAYHTERVLIRSPITQPYAALAAAHHERLDGSGYHRNLRGDALGRSQRLLAVADAFIALTSPRPHRPPHPTDAAAKLLEAEAKAGRLCRDSVALVLAAAGVASRRARNTLPAGLTEREGEVLGLVARGLLTKQIAGVLGITTRTVKHHIENIYEKTGVSTRAAAALFAARHDLAGWPNDP